MDTYYLDESGNSGDLTNTGKAFDFNGQPVFTLACVGVDDTEGLATEVRRLKAAHGLGEAELKSKSLASHPGLALDLVSYLKRVGASVFVEVVDKRFIICAHMVSYHVMPPVGAVDFTAQATLIRNVFAEYLYQMAPNSVLESFIAACRQATREAVHESLGVLVSWLSGRKASDEIAAGMLRFAADNLDEVSEAVVSDEDAHRSFLPIPDDSRTGKPIWMLPNLSCLTNIYARINRCHRRKIAGLTLVHDEQFYFEHIILDAKRMMETLAKDGNVPTVRFADYELVEQAALTFARSGDSAGIQAADILAGFVARHIRDGMTQPNPQAGPLASAFYLLRTLSDPVRCTGVNLVVSDKLLRRLGVEWQ